MHFGNDISCSYTMLDLNDQKCKMLEFITEEKDLKLNFSSHIVPQVKKAKKMIGLIKHSLRQNISSLLIQFLSQAAFRILSFNLLLKKDEDLGVILVNSPW